MEKEEKQSSEVFTFSRFQLTSLILFFLGIFVFSLGLGLNLLGGQKTEEDVKIVSDTQNTAVSKIIVHVDGAVVKPGVYELKSDSRVNDAIVSAGGFVSDANKTNVNLAAKVSDGQKVYVPKKGENVKGTSASNSTSNPESAININTSSSSELDKLPGVGAVTAEKIIAGRPYSSVDELLSRKIVGSSVYSKIKDLVVY